MRRAAEGSRRAEVPPADRRGCAERDLQPVHPDDPEHDGGARRRPEPEEGYPQWELAAHRVVFEAVSSGDSERARRAMARHLRDMQTIHAEGWQQLPPATAERLQLAR